MHSGLCSYHNWVGIIVPFYSISNCLVLDVCSSCMLAVFTLWWTWLRSGCMLVVLIEQNKKVQETRCT